MVNVLKTETISTNISTRDALYLSGVFMTIGTMANGNIYPLDIMKDAVATFNESSNMLGSLGKSDKTVIDLSNVSHKICDVHMDGKNIIGKLKILDTPAGNKVRKMILDGVKFSATSKIIGMLDDTKTLTSATIITWNILISA